MSSKYDKPNDYPLDMEDDNKKKKEKKIKKFQPNDLRIYPIHLDTDKLNEGETKYPLSSPVHLHLIIPTTDLPPKK